MSSVIDDVEDVAERDIPDHMEECVMPNELKPAEEAESLDAPSEASEAARMRCMPPPISSTTLEVSEKSPASAESSLSASRLASSPVLPPPAPPSLALLADPEAARMRRTVPLCTELASLPSSLLPVVESRSPRMRPLGSSDPACRPRSPASACSPQAGGASSLRRRSSTRGRSWPLSSAESVPCTDTGLAMERKSQSLKSIHRCRWEVARDSCRALSRGPSAWPPPAWSGVDSNHDIAW
mmetsp:Transcript_78982/g.223316  ORF Transcript_78982/g.223316 Transcript_78982/m.223316 type:complete len:240 (-) Transcript_78982:8-727(-)